MRRRGSDERACLDVDTAALEDLLGVAAEPFGERGQQALLTLDDDDSCEIETQLGIVAAEHQLE